MDMPFNRVPPELLSYIFCFCLPNYIYVRPSIHDAPLLLGRISRKWRYVSTTTPELWSSLQVRVRRSPSYRLLAGVESWLSKSLSHPLSLQISATPTSIWTMGMSKSTTKILNIILLHSSHCRRLHLQLGSGTRDTVDDSTFPLHLLNFTDEFSMLEDLEAAFHFSNRKECLNAFVSSSPRLQKVTFYGYQPSLVFLGDSLRDVKSLCSNSMESPSSCADVLRLASNLSRCRFEVRPTDNHGVEDESAVTVHQKLQQLYIGPTNHGQFFDAVTLPALEHLTIDGRKTYSSGYDGLYKVTRAHLSTWGQPNFINFLARSLCSLTKLSLFEMDISTEDFIECLSVTSASLAELSIEGGRAGFITPRVLNVLTYEAFNPTRDALGPVFLCPRLEGIQMTGEKIFGHRGAGREMVDMLVSRFRLPPYTPDVSRLKWAVIGGQYARRQRERLYKLEAEGLELEILLDYDDEQDQFRL